MRYLKENLISASTTALTPGILDTSALYSLTNSGITVSILRALTALPINLFSTSSTLVMGDLGLLSLLIEDFINSILFV